MKILSEPSSGKIRNEVAYIGRFGQCRREYVIPKNTWSPARDHMRGSFGRLSRAWSGLLTEAQRDAWCEAGPQVQSAKRLGKSGPLTGQQHFQGINSARACLGLDMLLTPPAPVTFGPSPVGQLVITNDDNGVRLLLPISGPVTEDIMVFGQAPCNSGRRKRRNVSYLGLLTTAQAGLSEITALYVARFGEPGVGQRVFIVTRQQKDGWEGFDHETHEIVPAKPADQQAAAAGSLPLQVLMHKGCTRDAQGTIAPPLPGPLGSVEGAVVAQASSPASEPAVPGPAAIRVFPATEAKATALGEADREARMLVPHGPFDNRSPQPLPLSRRDFVRGCALGALALASTPVLAYRSSGASATAARTGPASRTIHLGRDWLFGGKFSLAAQEPGFDDSGFARVTLPHCVAKLSWQNWEPAAWAHRWIYRRHLDLPPETKDLRVFVEFEGVMTGAMPVINGHVLPDHLGGYLPFGYEITDQLRPKDNVLAVAVDGRWQNVPPEGSPRGAQSIDYLEPAGLHRSVSLRLVPPVFLRDVFAKPVKVLQSNRQVEVVCSVDVAMVPPQPIRLQAELRQGNRVLASTTQTARLDRTGETTVALALTGLGQVALWEPAAPQLYDVVVTLFVNEQPVHDYRTRIGFREARFELDGFYLNGKRLQLFGLNRHELYPYVGSAMPRRVVRRDAEMLRREFNCNFVRCSHYPQSEAFLDACDELGLLVWEEVPGWGYIGDAAWKELLVRDVKGMIVRDRNHPAIVIWGTRANESANDVALYRRTKALAKSLDDSRPTSGSMTPGSRKNWQRDWHEDVFAFDDYHAAPDGSVGIEGPTPGVPYMLTEAVGQFNYSKGKGFDSKYRRAGDVTLQEQQALRHAQAHSKAAANQRLCGVIAWCAFDYASLMNSYNGVKCPGVADVFRIPKLGASFYQAQVDPKVRPIIAPDFYWDFGPGSPSGPGQKAAIFSNCERLELRINGKLHASVLPDRENYPHVPYPPFFADLTLDGSAKPVLRIDGFVGKKRVLSRSFSSDAPQDQLWLQADDAELIGDGSDATRLVFRAVDKFGAPRPFAGGEVALELSGPGVIVGDNPFRWEESGGVGAVWIKTVPGHTGQIKVTATHAALGSKSLKIAVRQAG